MKKRKETMPKQKEFSNSAFSALKGVQMKAPETAAPPAKKISVKKEHGADEMDLFLRAMSGVAMLGERTEAPSQQRSQTPVKAVVRKIEEKEQNLFLEAVKGLKLDVKFHEELPEEPQQTTTTAVSRLKQLRRGTIRIDYELDLHGLSKDEALDALNSFVKGAYRRGQKAVLVITGRGNHSAQEPVLKPAVEKWLSSDGKGMVVEFLSAPRQMGGEGAVVVFLRQAQETPETHG